MILSRYFLNPANRDVQRCIADAYTLHRFVLSLFPSVVPSQARKELGVLHRLELSERRGTLTLLIQSRLSPDSSRLHPAVLDPRAGADAASSAPMPDLIREGAHVRFRLRANPTRKIDTKSAPNGARRNGRRVPVRGDAARCEWLTRKLDATGFRLCEAGGEVLLRQRPDGVARGYRAERRTTHEAHIFDGVIEVVDVQRAHEAVANGIGPAKAFGFGLLSLSAF